MIAQREPQGLEDILTTRFYIFKKSSWVALKYTVYVDDNFHLNEEEARYKLGEFDSCEAAVNACMKIVDDFMRQGYREGLTFEDMWEGYMMFGEDPFIESDDPECKFSAWSYAKERCRELTGS